MTVQPTVVLAADLPALRKIHQRTLEHEVTISAYIEERFTTGHDAANREVLSRFAPETAKLVGIALRAGRKLVDRITKGARMHP